MNYFGNTLGSPTFSLSNCTSEVFAVDVVAVEVQAGTNWITYGSPYHHQTVGPTGVVYIAIPFAYATAVWKLPMVWN